MIPTIPKVLYLVVAVCTSPAGDDCQVYAMDSFSPGPTQSADCRQALGNSVDEFKRKHVGNVWVGCLTAEQLKQGKGE